MSTTSTPTQTALDPGLLTIEEARRLLRISKWGMYNLINEGRVATVHIGRKRFIASADFESLVGDLREEIRRG